MQKFTEDCSHEFRIVIAEEKWKTFAENRWNKENVNVLLT